jgi:hypothetical protein
MLVDIYRRNHTISDLEELTKKYLTVDEYRDLSKKVVSVKGEPALIAIYHDYLKDKYPFLLTKPPRFLLVIKNNKDILKLTSFRQFIYNPRTAFIHVLLIIDDEESVPINFRRNAGYTVYTD